ncbi:MAG: copper chaperone PCu(A)C [Hyphomicrobiales bacterium]
MTKSLLVAAGALALVFSSSVAMTHDHGQSDDHAMHDAMTVSVGALELSHLRVIETPPNARNAGGFLTITNSGDDNRLVSATSPVSERVELHTMTMDGDVMRMREIEGGIALPAGEKTELAPGGLHMMFIGLTSPFVTGETVPVTLTFESGDTQDVIMPVIERSMEMRHGDDDSDDHSSHGSHN